MRIRSLNIENFRAIRTFALHEIPDAVVLAGPNGCGKSSVFDAIRLLKSAYGQYHEQEWTWWFDEFQLPARKLGREVTRVLYNPVRDLRIRVEIELADCEREFLRENAEEFFEALNWERRTAASGGPRPVRVIPPAQRRTLDRDVRASTLRAVEELGRQLQEQKFIGELTMTPAGEFDIMPSPVLELAFSVYAPHHLGVIDYLGSQRVFSREKLGGINLEKQEADTIGQHALYNTQNKYNKLKTEMARSYIRELLAEKSGVAIPNVDIKPSVREIADIEDQLRDCAKNTIDDLVRIHMEKYVNRALVSCIRTRIDPSVPLAEGFRSIAERCHQAIDNAVREKLELEQLRALEQERRLQLHEALKSEQWKKEFRGRNVLRLFTSRIRPQIQYESFRNLIVNRMREVGYQPNGMWQILKKILDD